MEEKQSSPCMICGQKRENGIHILLAFLCDNCAIEMVQTDVQNVKYPYFVHRMKQVFYVDPPYRGSSKGERTREEADLFPKRNIQ
jgi:site-specific DNA-adenine methylase